MADDLWTIPELLKYWNDHDPDKEVFIFLNKYGRTDICTPRELYEMAGKFAARLRQSGFSHGDIISNSVPNSLERLITDLGILMAGCTTLNCQICERDGGDFWHALDISQCKGIVVPVKETNSAFRLLSPYLQNSNQGSPECHTVNSPKAPSLEKAILITRDSSNDSPSAATWSALSLQTLRRGNEEISMPKTSPKDYAYIFTTSGSTGYCKLVPRSHEELLSLRTGYLADKKFLNDRPLGWMGGCPIIYFSHCCKRVLQDTFDGLQATRPQDIWKQIEDEECFYAFVLPNGVLEIADMFKSQRSNYRLPLLVTGGQPIKKNVVEAGRLLADEVVFTYGGTEFGMVSLQKVIDVSQFKDFSSGQLLPNVQVRVVDDQWSDVPPGKEGNILVKSPQVIRHYYNFTPSKPIFTPDGWFITGDRGILEQNGTLYALGRDGDVINQGGIVIDLSWPEKIISQCPDVSDVTMVVLPSAESDDKMCACVVPRKGSELTKGRVLQFYSDNLVSNKSSFSPALHSIMFCDSFPFTDTGKIDKKLMRKEALKAMKPDSALGKM